MKRKRFSKDERERVYKKCNGRCGYCGCEITPKEMQIDHIRPYELNKDDEHINDIDNLLPACRSCNHRKGMASVETFRHAVERFPEVLMRDSVTYRNAVRFGLVEPKQRKIIFYFERINEGDMEEL